jgi:hypothetical protein
VKVVVELVFGAPAFGVNDSASSWPVTVLAEPASV